MNIEKIKHTKWYEWLNKTTFILFKSLNVKEKIEYIYWWIKKTEEKKLNNNHYEFFYTDYFSLSKKFYDDKIIMDIGCGPRGSLEWANNTKERYGLDPLANKYLKLGAHQHQMKYIEGVSENIPFNDNYFDVITSFNSLDHVENVHKSILEIRRVLKPNGLFLLIVDIHEQATLTEPSAFSWDIIEQFKQDFTILSEQHLEGHQMYKSIRKAIPFDHNNPQKRYGILTLKIQKKANSL